MKKKALIIGILGQDGSFMADFLKSKGYEVRGIGNPASHTSILSMAFQEKNPDISLYWMDILKERENFQDIFKDMIGGFHPDEVYNFAGVSDVLHPYYNIDLIQSLNCNIPAMILDCIIRFSPKTRFFQASSCLVFGNDKSRIQNEKTPYSPIYPYGISKMSADLLIKMMREKHGVFACSGILFPHESERRNPRFFSRKVTSTLARIKNGLTDKLEVGDLTSLRDYTYAPDVTEACWMMLQADSPKDYVIGSGKSVRMSDFLDICLEIAGLDISVIKEDPLLKRKEDTNVLCADISLISKDLGWNPKHSLEQMAEIMMDHDLSLLINA